PLHFINQNPRLEPYVYLVGDIFWIDSGSVLVLELKNLDGDGEYFVIDLRAQNPTPKREVASVLAARYPSELVATPRPEKSGSVDREMKIGGEPYHVERFALLPDGVVAIVQEESTLGNDQKYSDSRIVMGILPAATRPGDWVRKWDH